MRRRFRKNYWPVFLLLMLVGYFVRGNTAPTPARPVVAQTATEVDEPPERLPERTPTRISKSAELPVLADTAPKLSKKGQHFSLRVVGVHDGDTLTGLNDNKEQFKVRLDAIDAPELGQPFGQASKKALSDKVFGKDVVVVVKTRDKYGRSVGHVLIDGRDVNLEMLEEGMAWHYKKYDKNVRLQEAEQSARILKCGLWKDPLAIAPWDWRSQAKSRRK